MPLASKCLPQRLAGPFLAIVMTALAPPALAQAGHGLIDLDGDKRISYDEFVHSAAARAMQEMDGDQDGLVSRSEASVPAAGSGVQPAAVKFSEADANNDGRVGLSELKKPLAESSEMKKAFQALDRDRDGYLSGPELSGIDHGTQMRVMPQIRLSF